MTEEEKNNIEDVGDRLQSFGQPATRRLKQRGRGYSAFIRLARLGLPVAALVLIGIVAAQLSFDPKEPQSIQQLPQKENTTAGQAEVTGARFENIDDQGRKYTLKAASAARDKDNPDAIRLDKPEAALALSPDSLLSATSAKGFYDAKAQSLTLDGGLTLTHGQGYSLTAQDVTVNLSDKSASTQNPVTLNAQGAEMTASGLATSDNGDKIIFKGPLTILLKQKQDPPG
jgi:lipopolysaccharide export system protein LptC